LAWKVDTKLHVILATNSKLFSQLVFTTFVEENLALNDGLKVLRIQTVDIDGKAQNYEDIASHSKIPERPRDLLSPEDWDKHFDGIKSFSVFANQASEFEYKKNLTEGKTGVVQPDLIASNVVDSKSKEATPKSTPKKKMLDLEKTDEKIQGLKADFKHQEILKSPLNTIVGFPGVSQETPNTPDSPKFPIVSPSKSPTPSSISKASTSGPLSPKFPSSPARKKSSLSKEQPKVEKVIKSESKTLSSEKLISTEKSVVVETRKSPIEKPAPLEIPKIEEQPVVIKPIQPPPIEDPAKLSKTQSIRRKKQKLAQAKPPNILVYSDSVVTRDNVIKTLGDILKKNTYTVYPLTSQQASSRIWMENATLLIVCGSVNGDEVGNNFMDFFFRGGKVLCLCSDLLGLVLPTYHTAEVREHELVQFSYGKWKNIKMMHHIFCYQPSPIRKHFSQESDDPPKQPSPRSENP
jgi:biotin---protein ligase